MRVALYAAVLFALPTTVLACPDTTGGGKYYDVTATELWSPLSVQLVAGGNVDLDRCPNLGLNSPHVGFVIANPDVEINYIVDEMYDLVFRVAGQCDTVLLVNTPNGRFEFNDDDDGTQDPMIRFERPLQGTYDIWVGTYGSQECSASLIIETFQPVNPLKIT